MVRNAVERGRERRKSLIVQRLPQWHGNCTLRALSGGTRPARCVRRPHHIAAYEEFEPMTPAEVLSLIKEKQVKFADLRFTEIGRAHV